MTERRTARSSNKRVRASRSILGSSRRNFSFAFGIQANTMHARARSPSVPISCKTGSRFKGGQARSAVGRSSVVGLDKRATATALANPTIRPSMDPPQCTSTTASSFLSSAKPSHATSTSQQQPAAAAKCEQALKLVSQLRAHVLSRAPGGNAYLQRRSPAQRQQDEVRALIWLCRAWFEGTGVPPLFNQPIISHPNANRRTTTTSWAPTCSPPGARRTRPSRSGRRGGARRAAGWRTETRGESSKWRCGWRSCCGG